MILEQQGIMPHVRISECRIIILIKEDSMNKEDEEQLEYIKEWNKNHRIDYVRIGIIISMVLLGIWMVIQWIN